MRVTLLLVSILMSFSLVAQEIKGTESPRSVDNTNAAGGPDAFGYTFLDSNEAGGPTFAFEDISGSGTSYALADDGETPAIALGFDFDFYGVTQNSVFATSNGFLSFGGGEGGDFSNDCPLVDGVSPPDAIFPYWDDLDPADDGALLYAESFASCPYSAPDASGQCLIVQWEEFDFFPGDGEPGGSAGTFQAILFESGHIVYQYDTGFQGDGGSSTVAISTDSGANSLTYECNTAATISGGLAILYNPPVGTEPITRFQVIKDFDDDNPASVDVEISCNTGLPISQPGTVEEGDPITFVVTDFNDGELNCEITETAVEGYTASYDNGDSTSSVSCSFEEVGFEEFNTCTITNSLNEVEVEVTKWWMDENPQNNPINYAEAYYSCSNEVFGNVFGSLEFLGDGATDSFYVYPDWDGTTTCTVVETLVENGVEFDDSECSSLSVTPGNGASCNIYNTRLYEGIPTLSQYGLAIMALLMLGVGFVAFRRIA